MSRNTGKLNFERMLKNVAPGFDLTELSTTWSLYLPELNKTLECVALKDRNGVLIVTHLLGGSTNT